MLYSCRRPGICLRGPTPSLPGTAAFGAARPSDSCSRCTLRRRRFPFRTRPSDTRIGGRCPSYHGESTAAAVDCFLVAIHLRRHHFEQVPEFVVRLLYTAGVSEGSSAEFEHAPDRQATAVSCICLPKTRRKMKKASAELRSSASCFQQSAILARYAASFFPLSVSCPKVRFLRAASRSRFSADSKRLDSSVEAKSFFSLHVLDQDAPGIKERPVPHSLMVFSFSKQTSLQ